MIKTCDVVFDNETFPYLSNPVTKPVESVVVEIPWPVLPSVSVDPPSGPSPSPSVELPPPSPPQRTSKRTTRPPKRLGTWANAADSSFKIDKPKTWKQLLASPAKEKWLKAAEEELSALIGMGTWKLVP